MKIRTRARYRTRPKNDFPAYVIHFWARPYIRPFRPRWRLEVLVYQSGQVRLSGVGHSP